MLNEAILYGTLEDILREAEITLEELNEAEE